MRRRRTGRLVRVRYERKLVAIGTGLGGLSLVAISIATGGEGIGDPAYRWLVALLFPLWLFGGLRRELRRDVPKARPLVSADRLEGERTTLNREIALQAVLWLLIIPVLLGIGEGLLFGLFFITPAAAVTVYFIRGIESWERRSNAVLYRERSLFHRPRYVSGPQAATELGSRTASSK